MDETASLRSAVAELGEFFALPSADDPSWLPIVTLLDDAATVGEYARRAQRAIAASMGVAEADVPIKAAASSVQLSIAARLLSPVIGAAICLPAIPVLTTKSVFWQPTSSHRPQLGVAGIEWVDSTTVEQAAAVIRDSLIGEVLWELNQTMRAAAALSPQVLWGNVASAATGTVTVLAQRRPSDEQRGRALIAALIAAEPLLGAAEFVEGRFRRRNCCLFYQVPRGGYCGDCVLVAP